ncbi:MAG: pyrroline-5-carboxylate reductase [Oscillospiraceae bacterium]
MKYGFLGVGNMAGAIIKGLISNGEDGGNIYIYDVFQETLDNFKAEYNCVPMQSQDELVALCDVLLLSVKPNILDKILPTLKKNLGFNNPIIISIAVGKTIEYLEEGFGKDKKIVRVMPNINAKVMQSTSGYCSNSKATIEDENIVVKLFSAVGSMTKIPENMFSIFSVLAGSSPAFVYLYIDALARAAQKAGMPKAQAVEIVANTVMGSAKMILESSGHPWEHIDNVCSPGGTTIEGIAALEEFNFQTTITKAFDAVLEKDLLIQKAHNKKS